MTAAAPAGQRRPARIAALLLLALPLLLVGPSVFGGRTFVPWDLAMAPPASLQLTEPERRALLDSANFDVTEVPVWFVPESGLAGDQMAAGALPVWNPWARGGAPIHGHGLLGLCYPPNWLLLTGDPAAVLGLLAWCSFAVAGLSMFGLLRCLGLGLPAAVFGAATFQFSATLCANAYFWMRLASIAWLPAVLWSLLALDRAPRGRRAAPAAALAITFAMPWLAGFPPYATTVALLALALGTVLLARRWRAAGRGAALQLAVPMAAGALAGVLLALPQVLPSLQFFAVSARDPDPTLATIASQRLDPCGLLGYLVPDLFGHPTAVAALPYEKSPLLLWLGSLADREGAPALPNFVYTEYQVFVGTLGLLLAAVGAACGRGPLRAFAIAALAALVLLATFAPGAHLLFLLPAVRSVWPFRWLAPAAVLLAWLAALGVDRLQHGGRRAPLILLELAVALAAAALLAPALLPDADGLAAAIAERYGVPLAEVRAHVIGEGGPDRFALALERARAQFQWLFAWGLVAVGVAATALVERRLAGRCRFAPWLAIALSTAQLAGHGGPLCSGQPLAHATWTPVHSFLAAERERHAGTGGVTIARARPAGAPPLPSQLPPGMLLRHRVRDLHFDTHYDARSHQPLERLFGPEVAGKGYLAAALPDDERLERPLLDLLGVRFLLATAPLQHAGRRTGPELRTEQGGFFVYERPGALPRAFVVPALEVLADDEQVLAALLAEDLRPRERVLATAADVAAAFGGAGPPGFAPDPAAAARTVRFAEDGPTGLVLEIATGPAGWLVLADTWLPGWSATRDGEPVSILRAHHALRAVPVHAGPCTVRFRYSAPGLATGTWLALLAALAVCGTLALARCSRTRQQRVDTDA